MKYYITIKDVDNKQDDLILHFSEKDSVELAYDGGDDKNKPLVGSSLSFSIMVDDCTEGKYDAYFTTNEKKWLTQLWQDNQDKDDTLIWVGYLLPETYSEPWGSKTFFVNFKAVDGIGLLKGKYFKDEYYNKETPLMYYIKDALIETKVGDSLFISEAINNKYLGQYNTWNKIILDGSYFKNNNEKKDDMYKILESIIGSMECVLYQSLGQWYIEGINKRNFLTNKFKKFVLAPFLEVVEPIKIDKNIKNVTWLSDPDVSLVPPFKQVKTEHKKKPFDLSKDVVVLQNPPFKPNINAESDLSYYSNYWDYVGIDDAIPMVSLGQLSGFDNIIIMDKKAPSFDDDTEYITLRDKPYVLKDTTLTFKIGVKLIIKEDEDFDQEKAQECVNYAVFSVLINEQLIYTNFHVGNNELTSLNFNTQGEGKVELTHTVKESGFLDFRFHKGQSEPTYLWGYGIKQLEIKNNSDDDKTVFTVDIEEEASNVEDIKLDISDDETGNTLNWQLDYLDRNEPFGNFIQFEVYYSFLENGINYNVVPLAAAYAAEEYDVYYFDGDNFVKANNVNIEYNFNGGEESVLNWSTNTQSTKIKILFAKKRNPIIPQAEWLKWQDSIYEARIDRYGLMAAKVGSRIHKKEHLGLEGSCLNSVKFNDIIQFEYKNENHYFLVKRCNWNISDGTSKLKLDECVYDGNEISSIPPFVYAGKDLIITGSPNIVYSKTDAKVIPFYAQIQTIQWTKISGNNDAVINNSNSVNASFTKMGGEHYEFQLKVTDKNNNYQTDTFVVDRTRFSAIGEIEVPSGHIDTFYNKHKVFNLSFTPQIKNNASINIFYNIRMDIDITSLYSDVTEANISIFKNGKTIKYDLPKVHKESNITVNQVLKIDNEVLQVRNTDVIKLGMSIDFPSNTAGYNINSFYIEFVRFEMANDVSKISNLPHKINLLPM